MVKKGIRDILAASRNVGWVMEPQAKQLFSMAGLTVPRFGWAKTEKKALQCAKEIGYPVVAKVVSPRVIHKSDRNGVALGLGSDTELVKVVKQFSQVEDFAGVLVEEMMSGLELMVGAKIDYQFGPVILMGIGGTGVEIYHDIALRMAPLHQRDVESMVKGLRAGRLLKGYRGSEPINMDELTSFLVTFSGLVMELEEFIESIDLNPVICSSNACVIADARIMLKES